MGTEPTSHHDDGLLTTSPGEITWRIQLMPHEWATDGCQYEVGVGGPEAAREALLQAIRRIDGFQDTLRQRARQDCQAWADQEALQASEPMKETLDAATGLKSTDWVTITVDDKEILLPPDIRLTARDIMVAAQTVRDVDDYDLMSQVQWGENRPVILASWRLGSVEAGMRFITVRRVGQVD